MDVDYRKTSQGTYMVLCHPEQKEADRYSLQMILKNRIPGLLKAEQEVLNGRISLLYDITSMESFASIMEKEKIGEKRFRTLITDMGNCTEQIREYLLDMDQLLFLPDYLFLDAGSGRFLFCFDPFYDGDHQSDIRELFDRILGCMDYEDPDYVKLVYELHVAVQKDNFRFSDLSELMSRTDDSEIVSIRGMFEKNPEPDREPFVPDRSFLSVQRKEDVRPGGAFRPGIFDKLKVYLKGKTLRDVIADIDNGVFLQKLNRETKEPSVSGNRQVSGPGNRTPAALMQAPVLTGIGKNQDGLIVISGYPFSIGKPEGGTDAVIDSPVVSRMHARISEYREDPFEGCLVEDLNSTNGTYVNGVRLDPYTKTKVRTGDVIRFADREYILQYGPVQVNNPCISPENEI